MDGSCLHRALLAAAGLVAAGGAAAGAPAALTAADYARAERLMPYDTEPLVLRSVSDVSWLGDGELSYRTTTARGSETVLIDPVRGTRRATPDHQTGPASALPPDAAPDAGEARSPDKQWATFIRDDNLWVRRLSTGQVTQLTFDGVKDFGYATDNPGWNHTGRAVVSWSPDSRRIATYQQDERGVADMYVVKTGVGHPVLEAWKYAMPGDKVVPTIQRVIIDVAARKVVRLRMPPDQRRAAHCFDLNCGPNGSMTDVQWSPDGSHLAFVSISRDHKVAWLRIGDAATGAVRDVIREQTATFYESASGWAADAVNWRYLPASHEAIWFSQRDGWGHLYLYDTRSGRLENRITTGDWNVVELLRVDRRHRTLYFLGSGREAGNPYFCYLYEVDFDGRHLKLLTPERANHEVSMAPSGRYFVDSYSTPDIPPLTVLRDGRGRLIRTLEKADLSRLRAAGWQPPVPITVKARDGVTDLYGLLYRPTHFDPGRKYPLIDRIYPGPQIGSVSGFGFQAARGDSQAMAELGFIVVAIDGMGTSLRSKRFQDAYGGNLSDDTLPDQVAGIRELARRYPWIDGTRVGVYGHSGGAYAAVAAMLRYPDFFEVGVAESGNYDQRGYEADWGEQYMGLLRPGPGGTSSYDGQDDQRLAGNLRGHLLLMHGTTDDNVPPYLTMLLVQALIDANKDFDLLMLPNQRHEYRGAARLYAARRRWDYFVRYLLGARPPFEYALHPPAGAPLGSGW